MSVLWDGEEVFKVSSLLILNLSVGSYRTNFKRDMYLNMLLPIFTFFVLIIFVQPFEIHHLLLLD